MCGIWMHCNLPDKVQNDVFTAQVVMYPMGLVEVDNYDEYCKNLVLHRDGLV